MTKLFNNGKSEQTIVDENDNNNDNNEDNVDYVELLKKQGREITIEALAKKGVHADRKIEELLAELNTLKTDLDKRLSYEDLMDQIKKLEQVVQRKPDSRNLGEQDQEEDDGEEVVRKGGAVKQLSQEDIKKFIQETLTTTQTQRVQENNVNSVKEALEKAWGRNYQGTLAAKAKELGASNEFLENMAATHPKLLLKTLGVETVVVGDDAAPPRSTVDMNRGGFRNSGTKNWAYYEKIRKADPGQYRKLQPEMHRQAAKMGQDFYK